MKKNLRKVLQSVMPGLFGKRVIKKIQLLIGYREVYMTKNKWFRFLSNFKFAWSFAKLENKYSSTDMTVYEKVSSFDVLQSRYLEEIEDERNYLKTLWHIYSTYKDNPEELKEELNKFLEFWDECCDCTDGKVMPYKEEDIEV